ncbi:MAG: hypothetical protein P8Y14_20090 [Anaerolineales bacterium]
MDNRKPWIEWIKNIPNWVKAAILFIGVIVGFIISFRENSYLYVTVSVALLLVGAFGFSLFIAFTKTRPMIEGGRGMYRFERYRPWAFVGMVLILGLIHLLGRAPGVGARGCPRIHRFAQERRRAVAPLQRSEKRRRRRPRNRPK